MPAIKKKTTRKKKTSKKTTKRAVNGRDAKTGKFAEGNSHAFKKGECGNPLGRPPHTRILTANFSEMLNQKASTLPFIQDMAEQMGFDPEVATVNEVIIANHLFLVTKGKAPYMQEMFNRVEGKVIDRIAAEVTGKMGISDVMEAVRLQKKNNNG